MMYLSSLLLCLFVYADVFSMTQNDRWDASNYVNNGVIQRILGQKVAKQMGGYFDQTKCLLDVGCGDGFISQYLAASVGSAVGIDSSLNMINHASSKYKIDNLQFKHCSIEQLQSLEEYDIATAFFLLNYVSSIKTTLNRIYNALKSQGSFIATVWRNAPADKFAFALNQALAACGFKRDENIYVPQINRKEDWVSELEQMGFSNIKVETCDYQHVFNDKEEFMKWVSFGPHSVNQINMVPQNREEEYYQKVVEKYLEYIDYKGGAINFAYPAFLIIADK